MLAFAAVHLHAGTTWDGGGSDSNWGTGGNWNDNNPPPVGSTVDLTFAGTTGLTSNNNYTDWDDFRSIFFASGAGAFTLTGNSIDLFGKIENNSSNTQTISLANIAAQGIIEINPVSGNLLVTSANIYNNGNQIRVWGNNGNTLTFSSGTVISGGGSLAINQNSTVVFQSAQTYGGLSFINAGRLELAAGSSLSTAIRLGDTSGSAAAELRFTDADGGFTQSRAIAVRAGSTGVKTISSTNTSGNNTQSGAIALSDNVTFNQSAGGTLVVNEITGGFAVTKEGAGELRLQSSSSTYSGGTTVNAGRLTLHQDAAAGTGTITLANTGAELQLNDGRTIANSIAISDTGDTKALRFFNTNATINGGITINESTSGNFEVATGSGATLTINGAITGTGGAGLKKTNGGTLVLTGTNTYTGTTQISSGTLIINGDNSGATGAVNVSGTGTKLLGTGTIGGATTIASGSIHSAGTALGTVGSQTFSNGVKYNTGAIFEWDVAADGSSYDKINGDLLSGNSGAFFNIKNSDFSGAFWNSDHTWDDIFTAGGLATQFSGGFGGDTTAGVVTGQGGFTWNGAYTLKWTAVPEPTSALAGLLLGAGLCRRRRNA